MADDKIIVGLDIGTSVTRVAIGEYDDETGKIQIAGTAWRKSEGLRNGVIVNIEEAKTVIKETIEAAEQDAGITVESVIIGVGGAHIESRNSKGAVAVKSSGKGNKEITQDDINHVIESATAVPVPADRQKLHVCPQTFIVDGVNVVTAPIHRIGTRLEAEVHIITAAKTIIDNIGLCISRAGYYQNGVMLKTLAQTQSVCHQDEMDLGSILIDLGAGTTDAIVLFKGAPICTASIPVGGNLVTNDIAIVTGHPTSVAEEVKISDGCCWMPGIVKDRDVILPGVGGRPPEVISQTQLCQIIQARMEQIFVMIKAAIVKNTNDSIKHLFGNIILTGGGAQMEGVVELAQKIFNTSSIRLGVPENLGGIEEKYRRPDFATVIGLVLANQSMAANKDSRKKQKNHTNRRESQKSNESAFKRFIKTFF